MVLTRTFLITFFVSLAYALGNESENKGSNGTDLQSVLTSSAKKKVTSDAKESTSRPKTITEWINGLGASTLNFLPNVNPGGVTPPNAAANTPGTNPGFFESLFGNNNFGLPGTVGTVAGSAVLVRKGGPLKSWYKGIKRRTVEIKGGFLTFLTAIKSIVVPALLTILVMGFLVAGAAFFTCSLIDCQSAFGVLSTRDSDSSPLIGSPGTPLLLDDRNTIDYYDRFRPIFQAVDEGHHKYGTKGQGHGIQT